MTRKSGFDFFVVPVLVGVVMLFGLRSTASGGRLRPINNTTVEMVPDSGTVLTLDFYGPQVVRLFADPQGGFVRDPEAMPPAKILVDQPRRAVSEVSVSAEGDVWRAETEALRVEIEGWHLAITDKRSGREVVTVRDVRFDRKGQTTMVLSGHDGAEYYGGGVQNGRFAHRGERIDIVNTNNWTDGGVASPAPFFWTTEGYAMMWHTFAPGHYDFRQADSISVSHESPYLDVFVMVDDGAVALLQDFYQLTGNPVLLPKFGFYEGHLNAYNRDYWVETDEDGILMENGKRYRESQKDNGGIKESLNGEKDNYLFSARAVVDRYLDNDYPLGWVLPNDGYGAGYGQTGTLEGNVQNLKEFGDYARSKGVEIGLWTQSDLHPKEGVEPLLQRDIIREVRDAGVRVLKTDVAWVGAGYSFGLNGVTDVGQVMPYYGNDARPFIITLDGWAGTQRYAGVWTGDQTGGKWEYIRFHIPTYIGAGLSGQPNICSDMDGIFGGRNTPVNVRDFQWKTFTSMQLNMDGWGSNPKYPQALGEPAASINRAYLKMKSLLMPYTYSIAHEAVTGKPMVRAMWLEEEGAQPTLNGLTKYQFLYGPWMLVAPIYEEIRPDTLGNDIRHGIYLPQGEWEDAFTGQYYEGGRIVNDYEAPLWKLPLLVRRGAIIPFTSAHNVPGEWNKHARGYLIYPREGEATSFTEYDDDGRTEAYKRGVSATTLITQELNEKGRLVVTIHPTQGDFEGMERMKTTTLYIRTDAGTEDVTVRVGRKVVKEQFEYTSVAQTPFAQLLSASCTAEVGLLRIDVHEVDVTAAPITITVRGVRLNHDDALLAHTGALTTPQCKMAVEDIEAYAITPSWDEQKEADYYELDFGGYRYSTIRSTSFTLGDLRPETPYEVKVRAVNAAGCSDWAALDVTTSPDPLRHAIKGIRATTSCANQGGQDVRHLFDHDEASVWHTAWGEKAVPFDIEMDLQSISTLERLHYLLRPDAGNGTLMEATVQYSMDRTHWTDAGKIHWERSGQPKDFVFAQQPTTRYVRMHVTKAVGDFGSGQQMYVFRVPDTPWYIPGDINLDGRIDENDLTSYMNYTGLRQGDGDFDGYISKGDLNANGLIDAYDISNVALWLDEEDEEGEKLRHHHGRHGQVLAGSLVLTADRKQAEAGDEVVLIVAGKDMQGVNAWSMAIPYDATQWEYLGTETVGTQKMRNLTYDRLHTSGDKVLYPTFVNCGSGPTLEGDVTLVKIRFRAKQKSSVVFSAEQVLLVDRQLKQKNGK